MRRPYTVTMYRALVERLAAAVPDLALGADVITGFPGETDADFQATEDLVDALPLTYLHVFSYSDRRGTEAARRPTPRVSPETIRRRTGRLRRLGAAKSLAFRQAQVGREHSVLVLEQREREAGRLLGLTDNYLEVAFPGPDTLMRGFARVGATGVSGQRIEGVLVADG
jgi:threonylcarbamoyladenosine tRNA methylthiotransferase MtaB